MSSMPFWQNTTFAPEALILFTMSLSMLSSWSRKAFIWFGSRMRISALISVFSISNAKSKSAIFAFSFFLGIPEWTTSLSTIIPLTSCVSIRLFPVFFTICMLSMSAIILSPRFSAICFTASIAISAKCSLAAPTALLPMDVKATFIMVLLSSTSTGTAILSMNLMTFCAALRYPHTSIVGWIFWSKSSSAFFRSSLANTTAVVVPSPTISSCVFAISTIIFAAGCSTSISFRIAAPSFVIVMSPKLSISILSIPRGPSVVFKTSPITRAAIMLFLWASFPLLREVPSFKISTGWPLWVCVKYAMSFPPKSHY